MVVLHLACGLTGKTDTDQAIIIVSHKQDHRIPHQTTGQLQLATQKGRGLDKGVSQQEKKWTAAHRTAKLHCCPTPAD